MITKAPPQITGRGLGHPLSAAPTPTSTSSPSMASYTGPFFSKTGHWTRKLTTSDDQTVPETSAPEVPDFPH
jgi:hypothetical protein